MAQIPFDPHHLAKFVEEMRSTLGIPASILHPHLKTYLEAKEKADGNRRTATEVHRSTDQAPSDGTGRPEQSTPAALDAIRAIEAASERARLAQDKIARIAMIQQAMMQPQVMPFPLALAKVTEYELGVNPFKTMRNEGLRPGEVVGHRSWRVYFDQLMSLNGTEWDENKPMEGDPEEYRPAQGVHAFKEEHCLLNSLGYWIPALNRWPVMAVGTVDMWGLIIEHRNGYRAQYAAVRSIDHVFRIKPEAMRDISYIADVRDTFEKCEETLIHLRQRYCRDR